MSEVLFLSRWFACLPACLPTKLTYEHTYIIHLTIYKKVVEWSELRGSAAIPILWYSQPSHPTHPSPPPTTNQTRPGPWHKNGLVIFYEGKVLHGMTPLSARPPSMLFFWLIRRTTTTMKRRRNDDVDPYTSYELKFYIVKESEREMRYIKRDLLNPSVSLGEWNKFWMMIFFSGEVNLLVEMADFDNFGHTYLEIGIFWQFWA